MFDIYARTFMTATRQDSGRKVRVIQRRGWLRRQARSIDLEKL